MEVGGGMWEEEERRGRAGGEGEKKILETQESETLCFRYKSYHLLNR